MNEPRPAMLNHLKATTIDWIMRKAPGFRRHHARYEVERARNDVLTQQVTDMANALREVTSERDALFRGMAELLDERRARGRS